MNNDSETKKRFRRLLENMCEYYQKEKLTAAGVIIFFESLEDLDFGQIEEACKIHVKNNSFMPRANQIREIIFGERPTHEKIIAEARACKTPLGVMAKIEIGSWDLKNKDWFYLKSRAEEILLNYDSWLKKAYSGDFTERESLCMNEAGIDPRAALMSGSMGVPNANLRIESKNSNNSKNGGVNDGY